MSIKMYIKIIVVVLVVIFAATVLWAAGDAEQPTAAEKEYVTDPVFGNMVPAPEYGGT